MTKERFNEVKKDKTNTFIAIFYSYGNMGRDYFKSKNYFEASIRRVLRSRFIDVDCINKDYRDVEIKQNSVVYCDIPYNSIASNKKGVYYQVKFDYEAFYEWARNVKFPVYFSDYDAPDSFLCVWEKVVECRLNFRKRSTRTEKLFWNGRIK